MEQKKPFQVLFPRYLRLVQQGAIQPFRHPNVCILHAVVLIPNPNLKEHRVKKVQIASILLATVLGGGYLCGRQTVRPQLSTWCI